MSPTSPEGARLAAELRLLRERCGLTLSELAAQSAYSRSTWQRYLAGRALPPWPAVRVLCGLAQEPEPRLKALWELAEAGWSRRTATQAPPAPAAVPPQPVPSTSPADEVSGTTMADPTRLAAVTHTPRLGRKARARWVIGIAAGAAALLGGATVTALTLGDRSGTGSAASSESFHVRCTGTACNGQDPGTALCGVEPQTLLEVQTPAGVGLEIRYNPLCQAAWARVWNAASGDRLSFSVQGQPTQRASVSHPSNQDPFVYTHLVAVPGDSTRLTACVATSTGRIDGCYSASAP
ncbi:helix-turn-helix domain-containing protein [Streptacidiphilus jiangxiensis]|uniref:Helix-turn-helix domain-containing protein n=1 Tax=Streptacidiphilus jiangxiensis TaxID=235985 RepID=A0A1H7ZZY9_STRJI|nr:XRE family transcriptional regulator [Streptacidiphilus jiangxiensis]SEM63843.1 Helix-turn-helix domain-containing protein [Streptacidiphilus jiangxiensis]